MQPNVGNSWTKGRDLFEMHLGSAGSLQGKGAQDKLLKLYRLPLQRPWDCRGQAPRSAGLGRGGDWKEEDFLHTLGDYLRMCSTKTVE